MGTVRSVILPKRWPSTPGWLLTRTALGRALEQTEQSFEAPYRGGPWLIVDSRWPCSDPKRRSLRMSERQASTLRWMRKD